MPSMEGLSKKLRLLKRKVKSWTHEKTLAMKGKILFIEEEIHKLLGSSVSGLLSTLENHRLSTLKKELKLLLDHELRSARLQSRMTWASLSDANTKKFHLVASAHKNQNAIWGLQDDQGNLIEDDKGLKALGVRDFLKIYKDDG